MLKYHLKKLFEGMFDYFWYLALTVSCPHRWQKLLRVTLYSHTGHLKQQLCAALWYYITHQQ